MRIGLNGVPRGSDVGSFSKGVSLPEPGTRRIRSMAALINTKQKKLVRRNRAMNRQAIVEFFKRFFYVDFDTSFTD